MQRLQRFEQYHKNGIINLQASELSIPCTTCGVRKKSKNLICIKKRDDTSTIETVISQVNFFPNYTSSISDNTHDVVFQT